MTDLTRLRWQHRLKLQTIQQPANPPPLLTMLIDYPGRVLHETILGCTERQTSLTWRLGLLPGQIGEPMANRGSEASSRPAARPLAVRQG